MKSIIEKFNKAKHPVAFFMSDLHGIPPLNVLNALHEEGYDKDNDNHFVIVCGDITDGAGYDDALITTLRAINNLIAIKGNHDNWTIEGVGRATLQHANLEWLINIPSQIDTKHCLIAHGMYLKHVDIGVYTHDDPTYNDFISTWACPVLLGEYPIHWCELEKMEVEKINSLFKNSIDYYESTLTKPLFLGHYWPQAIKETFDGKGELIEDEKGFYSYGKINWVDSNVLQCKPPYISNKMRRQRLTVKIKKVEF